jgi:hypothetical protein
MSNFGIYKKEIFKVSEITHIDEHIVTNGVKVLAMDVLLNNAYFIDIEPSYSIHYPETNLYMETLADFVNKGVTPVTWDGLNIHPQQFIQFIQQTPRYSSLDISHCLFFFLLFENKKTSLQMDHIFEISADRTWPITRKELYKVVLDTPKGDFAHLPNSTLWLRYGRECHIYDNENRRMYFFDQTMETLLPLWTMHPPLFSYLTSLSLDEFENYKSTLIEPILSQRFPYLDDEDRIRRYPVVTTEIEGPCIVFKNIHNSGIYIHGHMMTHLVHILVALEMFYREHESKGARLWPIYFVIGDLYYHKLLEIVPPSYFQCKIHTEYCINNHNDWNKTHELKFHKPYYFLFNILHDYMNTRFLMDIVDDASYDYSTVLKETLGLFASPRLPFLPPSRHLKIFFVKKKSVHSPDKLPIITEEIENYVKDNGFIILSPDDNLTQRQLIEIYHQADVVIGFYGSFIANVHFMRPEAYFITISQQYIGGQLMLHNYHLVHLLYKKFRHDRIFNVWMKDNVTIPFEELKTCIGQVPLI